jgi:tetratricopeptide (TPR) repeat protein
MKRKHGRWKFWLFGGMLSMALITAVYFSGRYYFWPEFKAWRIERMNSEASAYLAAGDYANAVLMARKSLQSSSRNATAWRIAAAAADARQQPEALWYQDNLCREQPTVENHLEFIRMAVQFDVPGYALGAVETVTRDAPDDPRAHRLAAQVYERTNQRELAKHHLAALARLQPDDHAAQLDLASIEMAADPARTDLALRARVLALAEQPELRERALTLLLRDNLSMLVKDGTADLVRRLQLEPGLDVSGRLLVIEGMALLGQAEAPRLLGELQEEVADMPAEVARVCLHLIRSGRSAAVRPWVATLPEATRQDEDVQRWEAEALLVLRDAPALEAFLRTCRWSQRAWLRDALLAHAFREQGRAVQFAEAWRQALIGTGSDLQKSTALLARVEGWRWVSERHEVIWRIFAILPTHVGVQQILLSWERLQGNTVNLNRLFARIVEVQPADAVARNNLAYTNLLLDAHIAQASLSAAALAAANPQNPYFVTTHVLALYKQGRAAEALARLDAMSAEELAMEPVRLLLRALCLASLDRTGQASELMQVVDFNDMLPEEKRLAENLLAELARLTHLQDSRARLLASLQNLERGADPDATGGWLALVAPSTRAAASTDMQLADSLFAAADWASLQELLRTTTWQDQDYLRRALLANLERREGNTLQSQGQWQQALALADRDTTRLQDLRALAARWQWTSERLDTLNLIFERDAADRRLLMELLEHYRATRRTHDLMRVLRQHVAVTSDTSTEAVLYAYYCLLLDTNLAPAHVIARKAFETAPANNVHRMVYVFSLWRQQRAAEAMPLLATESADATADIVPVALLRATILTQLGKTAEARAHLAQLDLATALPEEVALADNLARQLAVRQAPGR